MSRGWQNLRWLPNTPGYVFTGMRHDGQTVKCRIVRGPDGQHQVTGEKLENLTGWREPVAADKK
jgi:hypothetical protein